jgi:hypothetical protein
VASHRRRASAVVYLRQLRVILHELNKTLEPLAHTVDMLILRCLFVWLLFEKAWKMAL